MSPPALRPYRGVLLDIEGTIAPVSFVYEVLFPYARRHLPDYVRGTWSDPEVRQGATSAEEQVSRLLGLMDRDVKDTQLKALQGRVWRAGYASGELRGQLFEDVPPALRRWQAEGKPVAIFSSGSVEAQQLLMRHSTAGDLGGLVAAWFDTTVGPKREAAAYREIARRLGLPPEDLLFATDIVAEADAAAAAGLQAVITDRPGNAPQPQHPYTSLRDFTQL